MGMGIGYTSYECLCGGIIIEIWDRQSLHVECDNCENPIPERITDHKECELEKENENA